MKKTCILLMIIPSLFLSLIGSCTAYIVPFGIPMEDEDEDFGIYTDSWAWAWLYALYNPKTQKYSNIQHDWNYTLEEGYTYQVWKIYSDDPEYPSTTTQILVFIDYWRSDALARVQFEPL